jgi:hypothetical protein
MSEELKVKFRDRFPEYIEKELGESFGKQNDKTLSRFMSRFFAEKVYLPKYPGSFSNDPDDIKQCIIESSDVDGCNDQGVDFICKDGNSVLIIQAKYSSGKKVTKRPSETREDIDHFRAVLGRLYSYRELKVNSRLRDACAEIDWENDNFAMYYITLRQFPPDLLKYARSPISIIGGQPPDLPERVSIEWLDEEGLNHEVRETDSQGDLSRTESVHIKFTPNPDSQPAWIRMDDESGRSCYFGRISGTEVAELFNFKNRKLSLFSLNIRTYLGNTETNKNIRTTAEEQPSSFFYFNNGISALATRIRKDESDKEKRSLICDGFSIINGAQTVRSLATAQKEKGRGSLDGVQVVLRITEYDPRQRTEEQKFIENVTKYNNTQNSIKISDFRSNDRVQQSIRQHFDELNAVDGKRFLYVHKRIDSQSITSGKIPIRMEEFLKTLHSFLYGPDDVFGGTSYMFSSTKDDGYWKLFGDSGGIVPTLDKRQFRRLAGVWFVCNYAKSVWKAKKESGGESQAPWLERRWMFFFALGTLLKLEKGSEGLDNYLIRMGSGEWTRKNEGREEKEVIEQVTKKAFYVLKKSYEKEGDRTAAGHRNWFRDRKTLESIESEASDISEMI